MKQIKLEIKNRVGYIIFNKPKANSYDIQFMQLLSKTIDEANADKEIKVIALMSKLKRFFLCRSRHKSFSKKHDSR